MVASLPLAVGLAAATALAAVVYKDAERKAIDPPRRWAALVFLTTAAGAATYAAVPGVPVPGLLVILVAGPAIYLLERDDSMHEDAADPATLPDQPREGVEDDGGE